MTIANLICDGSEILVRTNKTSDEIEKLFQAEAKKMGEDNWDFNEIVEILEEKGFLELADSVEENYYIEIE